MVPFARTIVHSSYSHKHQPTPSQDQSSIDYNPDAAKFSQDSARPTIADLAFYRPRRGGWPMCQRRQKGPRYGCKYSDDFYRT